MAARLWGLGWCGRQESLTGLPGATLCSLFWSWRPGALPHVYGEAWGSPGIDANREHMAEVAAPAVPPELPALFPGSASGSSQAPLAAVPPVAQLPRQAQPRSTLRGSLAGPVPLPIPSLPARLTAHRLLRGLSQKAAMKGTDSWGLCLWGLCLPRLLASLMDTLPVRTQWETVP